MLEVLFTSKSSFTTVYNEVIYDIHCQIIWESIGLVSTTETRKYPQHLCRHFFILPLSYLHCERKIMKNSC